MSSEGPLEAGAQGLPESRVVESQEKDRAPWHRNPWVLAALLGVFFVPAIRPFMRHVPEAPPILAQLPAYEAEDIEGTPFGSQDLFGEVYILGLGAEACTRRCTEIFRASQHLAHKIDAWGWDLWVVTLLLEGEPEQGVVWHRPEEAADWQWKTLRIGADELRGLVETVLGPLSAQTLSGQKRGVAASIATGEAQPEYASSGEPVWLSEIAHQGRLFLVDATGAVRGSYGIDDSGLDEVYHRAQHVHRDYLLERRRAQ